MPQYFVLLGGHLTGDGAAFGRLATKVPARRAPTAIASLTKLYLTDRRDGEAAGPFFSREFERAGSMIAPYEELDAASARPEDFIEPGACEEFRPATQAGECAA